MAKIFVTYNEPVNKDGFDTHYFNVHVPLVQKMPLIKSASVHHVKQAMNTDEKLYLIAELEFHNFEDLNQALGSPEGQEVVADVANLVPFLEKPPLITLVE
mgnify:CR=1 FL=1